MAPKRKALEFDEEANKKIIEIRDKFDRESGEFHEEVHKTLQLCKKARAEEKEGSLKIQLADKDAFKTLESYLVKASRAEAELSKVWIETFVRNCNGTTMSQEDFQDLSEFLTDGRKDIDETIKEFEKVSDKDDNGYCKVRDEAVKDYRAWRQTAWMEAAAMVVQLAKRLKKSN